MPPGSGKAFVADRATAATEFTHKILMALRCERPTCACHGACAKGEGLTHCPAHHDNSPSLRVSPPSRTVFPLLWCFAGCTHKAVLASLRTSGVVPRKTTFVHGSFKHTRKDLADGSKDFSWDIGAKPSDFLYRSDTLTALKPGAVVLVVEGETAAEAAVALGVEAVATVSGAASVPSAETLSVLRGFDVVLCPDNDQPGRHHMQRLAGELDAIGIPCRWVEVPGLPDKGDLADYAGYPDSLMSLVAGAPRWELDLPAHTAAEADDPRLTSVFAASAPTRNASLFLNRAFSGSTLVCYQETFYRYRGGRWEEFPEASLRAEIYQAFDGTFVADKQGREQRFNPNAHRVSDILDALRAVTHIDPQFTPLCWLDGRGSTADGLISMQNGILDLTTRMLLPHTRELFTYHSLPFDYDPAAPEPRSWLAFLESIWADDASSVDALQEMFGYIVSGSTRQQKMFLIVGPKRSGKGTIARVLTETIGKQNTAGVTLNSLTDRFGIAPLITRPLAIISDARLGKSHTAIVERLLSISGEDLLTVDRKHRAAWTGTLPTRFVVCTNELPQLDDNSGALASRFIVLTMTKSFLGQEDPHLTDRLLTELPGIFNWSLVGLARLNARERFIQPASGDAAVAELNDLASPISVFLADKCSLGPNFTVSSQELFQAWLEWCVTQGRDHHDSAQTFGKNLKAAVPTVRTTMRRGNGGERVRWYEGVGLRRD